MHNSIDLICERMILYGLGIFAFFLPIYNSLCSTGIALAVFFMFIRILLRWNSRDLTVLSLPIYAFIFFSVASLINSVDIQASLIGLRKLSMYFFIYLAFVNVINSKNRIRFIVFIFFISAFFVSLDGIYQLVFGQDWFSARPLLTYPHRGISRISASFHYAGSLGIYLSVIAPSVWCFILFYFTHFKKIVLSFAGVTVLLAMVLTFAPGAALGFSSAVIFFSLIRKDLRLSLFLLACIVVGFFLLPVSLTSWPHGSLFDTIFGRLKMWRVAFQMLKLHPFIGMGLRTFSLHYQSFCLPGDPFCSQAAPYAHNMYLQLFVEVGLYGFLAFIWLICSLLKGSIRAFNQASDTYLKILLLGLAGGMVSYLAHGMFESSIYTSQGALLFWALLGLLAGAQNIITSNSKKPLLL